MKIPSRPLQETIRPMKDMPGVSGTFRLSNGPYGSVGARRLVCLTDGSIAVEEVLLTESHSDSRRFRYVVWNYTREKMRDVDYAVGEFVHTQIAPDKTQVNWTYRFALKSGIARETLSGRPFSSATSQSGCVPKWTGSRRMWSPSPDSIRLFRHLLALSPSPVKQRLGVAIRLFGSLEHQVAGRLEGHGALESRRHRLVSGIRRIL